MSDASTLYEFQKIDLTWDKVKQRLLQIQSWLEVPEELVVARTNVQETTEQLHGWQAKQKDAELESQSLAAKITETETEMMSGRVSNVKELEALNASLEALQRHRSTVDDSAMEAMMAAEELAAKLSDQQATLDHLEDAWVTRQKTLKQDAEKMKRNYLVLRKKREQEVQTMDSALLATYDDLRRRKNGVAVALVENDSCGACHVQVPTGVASMLRGSNDQLVMCPSCGRVLAST